MNGMAKVRGLDDVKTSISTHARATPRRGEMNFLEAYILQREAQRLTDELTALHKRGTRIASRLDDINLAIQRLTNGAPLLAAAGQAPSRESQRSKWQSMAIAY